MGHPEAKPDQVRGKLPLIASPAIGLKPTTSFETTTTAIVEVGRQAAAAPNLNNFGFRDGTTDCDDCPEFTRHEEATNVEVFYDLFFAANLCVFAEVQDITNTSQLATFICYFCLLWLTWAVLGLFDVRFVTDSIFERMARAAHFGVMVGFAVIAPAFDLSNQNPRTFRTMSLILTVSRFTLATQYGSILWHVRRYKTTHVPLGLMAGMNLASSIIYLGVAFGFKESGTTSLWVVWFIITGIETILSVAFSLKWKVLGFQGTHLTTRMSLLTFILMGEGIITICSAVTKIVLNANSWTSATTGNVTAGIGTIYVIFMIYFDWRRHLHLPRIKQLAWSFMHFPFHLALKLFIACSSQFVIWWKVFEVLYNTTAEFEAAFASVADPNFNVTTEWFVNALESTIGKVFDVYPPKFQDTITAISDSLGTLAEIPADFWEGAYPEDDPIYGQLMNVTETLSLAVENSLFATFNINGFSSFTSFNGTEDELQRKVEGQNFSKFNTVFTYAFIAAGCTLILLNILFIISRTRNWTPFNYVRKGINFLAGIGLCLISIVVRTPVTEESDQSKMFAYTPWPLPTLLLVFFCILIINHLPHPPPFFFGSKAVPSDNAGGVQEWENIKVSGDASSAENKTAYQRVHVRGEDVEAGHHGHSH